MLTLPQISNYGEYSSNNYGAHTLRVDIGPLTVWFSYRTPVAFHVPGHDRVVHENDWGPTTGEHLKWIDRGNKKARVSAQEFDRLWKQQVGPLLGQDAAEVFEAAMA